jgi:hypothetical protein
MEEQIIKGERIQQLCDIYLGLNEDFYYNPLIAIQRNKLLDLSTLNENFNNPQIIFCYSHRINLLSKKINLFKNKFVLFTHNSDENIMENEDVKEILKSETLFKWFSQNLIFKHPKLLPIPIGFANNMWPHGNIEIFKDSNFVNSLNIKSKKTYFKFNMQTNKEKRDLCFQSLKDKLEWLNNIHPVDNLKRLAKYEFCICPDGNGIDTHRLSECIYLKVVPIVLNSPFIQIMKNNNIPLLILDSWDDYNEKKLNYLEYNFDNLSLFNLDTYKQIIENARNSFN